MSLQGKLATLVALLGLAASVSVGAAWWAMSVIDREVSTPFAQTTQALRELNGLKAGAREQAAGLSPGEWAVEAVSETAAAPGQRGAAVLGASRSLAARGQALDANDRFTARVGPGTWRALRERLGAAHEATEEAALTGSPALEREAAAAWRALHELLSRSEARTLSDADLAAGFGEELRGGVQATLAMTMVALAGVAGLAFVLVRRWIVRPVAELRLAALRIAEGDLAHRVRVRGEEASPENARRDELLMLGAEVNHMASMVSSMQEERVARERLAVTGEMVRRLAHNLRNPLSGIRGLAEITRNELPADSEVRENQDRIMRTVDSFERWLNDLLRTSTPAAIEPEALEVGAWLARVGEALAPMAESRGVRLVVESSRAPARASFDPRHLEHALVALVCNGIEATPRGGTVWVTGMVLERSRGESLEWEVRVEDQGCGVPLALRQRIFEPHFTTKQAGAGIGLAVATQAVRGHGGAVWVEDPPPRSRLGSGPGAVFVVRLPLEPRVDADRSVSSWKQSVEWRKS